MAALDQAPACVVGASLDKINTAFSMRVKSKGQNVNWAPLGQLTEECNALLTVIIKSLPSLSKDELRSIVDRLNVPLEKYREFVSKKQPVPMSALKIRLEVNALTKRVEETVNTANYLLNTEDPEETSEDFQNFLFQMTKNSLAEGKRTYGKKALMSLFD